MRISPVFLALLGISAPAFAGVTVTSPANSSTVTSPVKFAATATTSGCSKGIASIGIYVDNQLKYVANATSLNTSLPIAAGQHNVVVQDWDHCGGFSKTPLALNVTAATAQRAVSFGTIAVATPVSGENVTSPFLLSATNSTCEAQPVSAMAYSIDSSSQLMGLVHATSLAAQVSVSRGAHVLHVKSWGSDSAACDSDISVNAVTSAASVVPSSATATRNVQSFLDWKAQHDPGTNVSGGTTSSGTLGLVTSPSVSGAAMRFNTTFQNSGGELYWSDFGNDTTSQNWFLDEEVYIASGSVISNIESDLNQVDPNGNTIIMGFQCDHYSGTWDYAYTDTKPHWQKSTQHCDARKWTTNAWHHVQIWFSRDSSDNVTYRAVWLDNVQQDINATVHSSLALGWAKVDVLNYQVDGYGTSGTSTTYLDNVTIYHW